MSFQEWLKSPDALALMERMSGADPEEITSALSAAYRSSHHPEPNAEEEATLHIGGEGSSPSTATKRKPSSTRVLRASAKHEESGEYHDALDRYDRQMLKGQGAMGKVWLAFDKVMHREVALKELTHKFASHPDVINRFLREARVTGQLDHPNIIPVYEIASGGKTSKTFYTMKFIRGHSLRDHLATLKRREANEQNFDAKAERLKLIDVMVSVCEALAHAHERGVIHRDVKPDNIMLGNHGEVLLVDWGLAKIIGERAPEEGSDFLAIQSDDAKLSMDGQIMGTPAYMPPEQAEGRLADISEKSDIFSLGAVLFEIASGRAPIASSDKMDAREAAAKGKYQRIDPATEPWFKSVIRRAMAFSPYGRYKSASELADDLRALRAGGVVRAHKYRLYEQIGLFYRTNKRLVHRAGLALIASIIGVVSVSLVDSYQRKEAKAARIEEVAQAQEEIPEHRYSVLLNEASTLINDKKKAFESVLPASEPVELSDTLSSELLGDNGVVQFTLNLAERYQDVRELALEPIFGERVAILSDQELIEIEEKIWRLRFHAAGVAAVAGAFTMAEEIVRSTPSSSVEDGRNLEEKERAAIREFIGSAQAQVSVLRRKRISFILTDVSRGLSRPDRDAHLPRLDDYVFELVGYRSPQTLEILSNELLTIGRDLHSYWDFPTNDPNKEPAKGVAPFPWSEGDRDTLKLCARVIGRLEMGEKAVEALEQVAFLARDHGIVTEIANALAATKSREGWRVLFRLYRARKHHGAGTMIVIKELLQRYAALAAYENATNEDKLNQAMAYHFANNGEDSLALIDEVLADDPTNRHALGIRHISFHLLGDFEKGIAALDKLMEVHGESARAFATRGYLNGIIRKFDQTIIDCTKGIELEPEYSGSYNFRGWAKYNLGRIEEAISDYRAGLAVDPTRTDTWANLGFALNRNGQHEEAIKAFDEVSRLKASSHYATFSRGKSLYFLGRDQEAIREIERAIELSPDFPEFHNALGTIHQELGNLEVAKRYHERAIELGSLRPRMILGYVETLIANGEYDDARDDIDDLVKDDIGFHAGTGLWPCTRDDPFWKLLMLVPSKGAKGFMDLGALSAFLASRFSAYAGLELATHGESERYSDYTGKAFKLLQQASDEGFLSWPQVKDHPSYQTIRKDPRWAEHAKALSDLAE